MAKGEIVVQDLRTGHIFGGVEAVRLIFRHVPLYIPLLLLLKIPAVARVADAARGMRSGTPCEATPEVPVAPSHQGRAGEAPAEAGDRVGGTHPHK